MQGTSAPPSLAVPYERETALGSNIGDVMDPILDAGRALARGEPLRTLSLMGQVDSAIGLTLRGIAYAQLGDLALARNSLERAFAASDDPLMRARARAALVEIELDEGEPSNVVQAASASAKELARLGDVRNAAMQRLVVARAEVLRGRLGEARHGVEEVLAGELPPGVRAVASLALAEIAIRSVATKDARAALVRAREGQSNRVLEHALNALESDLSRPLARVVRDGQIREVDLFAIEELSSGEVLLVDACRRLVIGGRVTIPLARRPALFGLLLVHARAWPASVPRDVLAAEAFGVRRPNASHRMRLRVEVGRLRKVLDGLVSADASDDGYVLTSAREVAVLLPSSDDDGARIAMLLGDGAAWTARGLAEHAGVSIRTAQRALTALVEGGGAVRSGRARGVRYTRPGTPVASRMLLLGLVPRA